MAETELVGVTASRLLDLWDDIVLIVAETCKRSSGKYEAGDIMKAIAERDMQLWVAMDGKEIEALAVTELVNFPRRRVCRVLIVTGEDRDRWIGHSEIIASWARGQGCASIEALARPGWQKTMKSLGWQCSHVLLEKEF